MIDSENFIAQEKIRGLLVSTLVETRERNPSFSLRMFARRLDIQAPVLSEVMNGKRLISRSLAEKILYGLGVAEDEASAILSHFPVKQSRSKKSDRAILDPDCFQLISDWWYMAILSLSETDNCRCAPDWIAKRLNIPIDEAAVAVSKLIELGFVEEVDGHLRFLGKYMRFSSTIPNSAVRKHHGQGFDLAEEALHNVAVELREFGSITFKAEPGLLDIARKKLRATRNEIASLMNTNTASEVYRLQMQLFPLTKTKETEHE